MMTCWIHSRRDLRSFWLAWTGLSTAAGFLLCSLGAIITGWIDLSWPRPWTGWRWWMVFPLVPVEPGTGLFASGFAARALAVGLVIGAVMGLALTRLLAWPALLAWRASRATGGTGTPLEGPDAQTEVL